MLCPLAFRSLAQTPPPRGEAIYLHIPPSPLSPSILSLLRYQPNLPACIRKLTSIYLTHRVVVLPTPSQRPLTPFEDVFFGAEGAQFLHIAQFH